MPEVIDFDGARERLTKATRIILDAENAYEQAVQNAADAEAVYRAELAKAFTTLRADGAAVEEARIKAHGATATFKREALAASGMVKVHAEKVENARDSRRSLWRLLDWAAAREMRAAVIQGRMPENTPNTSWP